MVDTVGLGRFLYLLRISHHYTQSFVEDITDISERALRYIESGEAMPRLDTYWILCDLYGIDPALGYTFYYRSTVMKANMEIFSEQLIHH